MGLAIGLDIDGVLNRLHDEWSAWIAKTLKPGFTVDQWTGSRHDWIHEFAPGSLDYLNMVGVFENAPVRDDAMKVALSLFDRGHTLYTVTSCNHAHNWVEKDRWLDLWFGYLIPKKNRIVCSSKGMIRLDVLVDDQLNNCYAALEAGTHPIVFDQPWNRDDDRGLQRVKDFAELERVLL